MIRMHIFDYRFLRDSSVDPDVVMRGWMSYHHIGLGTGWRHHAGNSSWRSTTVSSTPGIRRNLNWMRSGSITPVL